MDPGVRARFLQLLADLAEGRPVGDRWQSLVVAHYPDPQLERARVELVRASIEDEGAADPIALRTVATAWRDAL